MKKPQFNEKKATQLAAAFIDRSGGSINYMKLIKLMYLADREALLRWNQTVTKDSHASLDFGPVVSRTYDLIKSSGSSSNIWGRHISAPESHQISLLAPCPPEDFSQAEEALVDEIFDEYGCYNEFELADLLHRTLPEWKDPKGSSTPISTKDILEAGGKSADEILQIETELENLAIVESILG